MRPRTCQRRTEPPVKGRSGTAAPEADCCRKSALGQGNLAPVRTHVIPLTWRDATPGTSMTLSCRREAAPPADRSASAGLPGARSGCRRAVSAGKVGRQCTTRRRQNEAEGREDAVKGVDELVFWSDAVCKEGEDGDGGEEGAELVVFVGVVGRGDGLQGVGVDTGRVRSGTRGSSLI